MAISIAYEGNMVLDMLDNAFVLNSTNPETTDGVYQIFIGHTSVNLGQIIQLRVLEKVRSTSNQSVVFIGSMGYLQNTNVGIITPPLVLMHGWTVDLMLRGALPQKTVRYSIRKVG